MVFFATTVAFVQTLVVLYLLPLRRNQARRYPYIKALLVLLILHLGIKLFLLAVLRDEFLFGRLNSFTTFAYGPLLLFQLRQSTGRSLRRATRLAHLTPFFAAFGLYLFCVLTRLPVRDPAAFQTLFEGYRLSVLASCYAYCGYVFWAAFRTPFGYKPDRRFLLQVSSLFLLALAGGRLVREGAERTGIPYEAHTFPYLVFGLISFLCLRFFFTQSEIRLETQAEQVPAPEPAKPLAPESTALHPVAPEKEAVAYEKSGLSDEQMEAGWRQMEALMQRERPFVDPELSLDDLAERLKLSRQHVSQILNQGAGRNFYAYVNEYRVREMQRLMKQRPSGRILELAFGVGFQSKTTLNAYFKKVTGVSPTQYQERIRGERLERAHS